MLKKVEIIFQNTDNEIIIIKKLFQEYADNLAVDLCFQNFQEELDNLPGKYAPPEGLILLAKQGEDYLGVVALRKIEAGVCEMKRLYVRPQGRGLGLGKLLSKKLLEAAKTLGYHTMKLDTLGRLTAATNLYRSLGFQQVQPYNVNPEEDVLYFEKRLA